MTKDRPTILELAEYEERELTRQQLPKAVESALYSEYQDQFSIDFPPPGADYCVRLRPRGWIGYIPIDDDFAVRLKPRTPIGNICYMLAYAYELASFEFLEGRMQARSLRQFYEQLARRLAEKVLERARQGFYRAYISAHDRLPYGRGRVDVKAATRRPWRVKLPWNYEEHTVDIQDNRILLWTLFCLARGGVTGGSVHSRVREAYRILGKVVSLVPQSSDACRGRQYHRLNDDYRLLHTLCRFFLENAGPTHEAGSQEATPFLVNTPRLFERFVGKWLDESIPPTLSVTLQETVGIGIRQNVQFQIDLVIRDVASGAPLCVIDTKYKRPGDTPAPSDVAQVIAYAEAMGCRNAFLVYPEQLTLFREATVGNINVHCLTFDLSKDLQEAGENFLERLVAIVPPGREEPALQKV